VRKSTLIILGLGLLSAGLLKAEPNAPVMPGTKNANPVQYLPGMSATGSGLSSALPQPLITDLTNFPNPFDSRKAGIEGTTVISYMLAKDAKVTITLYDLLGHKVREWDCPNGSNGARQGANAISWDGTNEANQKVSKGGYLAEIVVEAPETTATVIRKIGVIH
jgi:hypothetical protein